MPAKRPAEDDSRYLSLPDGSLVDLSQPIKRVDNVVVEALRQRVLALENNAGKKAKTASASALAASKAAAPAPKPAAASSSKTDNKMLDAKRKAICDRLKQVCKTDTHKWRTEVQTVKVEEAWSWEEFEAIFGQLGVQVQPTATNKPTSKVLIRNLTAADAASVLNGKKGAVDYKGYEWSRGTGLPNPRPAKKLNLVPLEVERAVAEYSKPSNKLTLKVDMRADVRDDNPWGL